MSKYYVLKYIFLFVFVSLVLFSCNNSFEELHDYQIYVSSSGILKLDMPFEDLVNEQYELSIYNNRGKCIAVQPIPRKRGHIERWKNDTIFIILHELDNVGYLEKLNGNEIDYLKDVSTYKLKYCYEFFGSTIVPEKRVFERYKLNIDSYTIDFLYKKKVIGSHKINDILFNCSSLRCGWFGSQKSIEYKPANNVSTEDVFIEIFETFVEDGS